MRRVYSRRAISVLYNFIKSNNLTGKVIMPSNICESVPATYIKLGINPVFCDVNLIDWQIEKKKALKLMEDKSVVILHYNHTYGFICDDDYTFLENVRNLFPRVFIVDDKCLCYPELQLDTSFADLVLFSTGHTKCVDIGWGGFGYLSSRVLYSDHYQNYNPLDLEMFDRHVKYCHRNNMPFDDSIIFSDWIDMDNQYDKYFELIESKMAEVISHKENINEIYKRIPGSFPSGYNNWRYQLLLNNQKECYNALFKEGLYCSYHYKSLGEGYFSDTPTPNNAYLESHVLNLFNDHHYTKQQAELTADILGSMIVPVDK